MRVKGYRVIAPYYEKLRNLFFPGIRRYQAEFHRLKPHLVDRIVIVGGGGGDVLKPVLEKFKKSTIYYVEPSASMMQIAQKRFGTSRRIFFIEEPFEQAVVEDADIIILPFVLDIINRETLPAIAKKTRDVLKSKGFVLFSDFCEPKGIFAKIKLALLYLLFFPMRGKLQFSLPDYDLFFEQTKLRKVTQKTSKSKQYVSALYQKK